MKNTFRSLFYMASLALVMHFSGCTGGSPMQADFEAEPHVAQTLEKASSLSLTPYPQDNSLVFSLANHLTSAPQINRLGKATLPNGSEFSVWSGAIQPTEKSLALGRIIIEVSAALDQAKDELIYEFAPHGTHFDPPAEMWFSFGDLSKTGVPEVYYIEEDGSYTSQKVLEVDRKGKRVKVLLHHFSRYAIAHSQ